MAPPNSMVSMKHLLDAEIISVTSTMRRNSRWSSSSPFVTIPFQTRDAALGSTLGLRISTPSHNAYSSPNMSARISAEAELMLAFQDLKRVVRDTKDLTTLPLPHLLHPFFAIIRSPLSTGPITSVALSSLHAFFVNGLIRPDSLNLEEALGELSHTVSHCKFEASDSSGDEVTLLKIMTVIEDCMTSAVGQNVGDIEICEMLETVLTTCCQMRLSETLRRAADNSMQNLVRIVFARLPKLDPTTEEAKLQTFEEESADALTMNVSQPDVIIDQERAAEVNGQPAGSEQVQEAEQQPPTSAPLSAGLSRSQFGLPSIIELLRVLISVLDPNSQQHTDSTRLVALRTLDTAFQAAGESILSYPSLMALISDQGCKFLFQLARSENHNVLGASLRTIATVMQTSRKQLKLQQELLLAFTIDRLAPPALPAGAAKPAAPTTDSPRRGSPRPGTPSYTVLGDDAGSSTPARVLAAPARGDMRDLVLESLGQISSHSSFMVDVYTNYDCDVNCENLFERLIDFLTKAVYPSHYRTGQGVDVQQRNSQFLCLELLLVFVNDMAARNASDEENLSVPWPETCTPPSDLLSAKSQKKLIITGATLFNTKPAKGLAFLAENKLIYQEPDLTKDQSLARFLKTCTRLDKRLLGDYISKPDNIDLLDAFMRLFDFKGKPIADALRELLETFRLPGEAQQIDRITETFSKIYFASEPDEIQSQDAVYILAFSIILLNTDLHSPQIRKRMTIEDYQRNLRGQNGGQDFTPTFLQNVYDSIRKKEIVMPEEHTGQLGFEFAWKELLARSRQAGDLMVSNSREFDFDMFKTVWKPVISAIAYAFVTFEDDYIIQRAITGFRQCATLAGVFQLPEVFDFVVVSLSQATGLLDQDPAGPSGLLPIYPVVKVEDQDVTVSKLSVEFGTNFKGQLAAVVLFNIVNGHGNAVREGWTQIFEMFQMLFLHSLLPIRMLQMEDFLGGVSMIPLQGPQPRPAPARSDGGLLSALSSYLMTGTSAPTVPEATESDVEKTLSTIDCITSCRLDELYSQVMTLDQEAVLAAVKALEALAHERTVARLKQESSDDSTAPNDDATYSLPYDPASVFLLETMVSIAIQRPEVIDELWPIIFNEHLSPILSASLQYSDLLIERAVVGLLKLCPVLAPNPSLRDQIYVAFDLLAGLPTSVALSVAQQVVTGVSHLVQNHRQVIRSATEWNLVFALIRSTLSDQEASKHAFDLISSWAMEGPSQIVSSDNFSGLVTLLDDFAALANVAALHAQAQAQRRRDDQPKPVPAVERGSKAVEILSQLRNLTPSLEEASHLSALQAWRQLWLPLLGSFSRQSANAVRGIRQTAVSSMNRLIMGDSSVMEQLDQEQSLEIFSRVIFPLVEDLLRPEVFHRDPRGMPETQLRVESLLTRTFKRFVSREHQVLEDIQPVWIQILDILGALMDVGGPQLREAIPEDLRGVVLVMHVNQLLLPPQGITPDPRTEFQQGLWNTTLERLEAFLPGFLSEVIPSPPPPAPPTASEPEEIPAVQEQAQP